MSEFDADELERCWNCGTPVPGSNQIPPRTQTRFVPPWRRQPMHILWLILPWCSLVAVAVAVESGLGDWVVKSLPFGLGSIAVRNSGWGFLLVLVGSSTRWAYLRYSAFGFEKLELYTKVIGMTIVLILIHACIPIVLVILLAILIGCAAMFRNAGV
jgi:hypothetical protein